MSLTFYYCNNVFPSLKEFSLWRIFGFVPLSGHVNGEKQCRKIYFPNIAEYKKFINMKNESVKIYNNKNSESHFSWGNTLKLELKPHSLYSNTYTVISCTVHKGRFCSAK
jgi:hypothetical protein